MIVIPSKRIKTLDFLRGIAILGVIAIHTSQYIKPEVKIVELLAQAGKFGVQLFYFISALTMCYMWELRKGEKKLIKKFYIRRFFRIVPLFWMGIAVYLMMNGFEKHYWAPEGINTLQI